jgi:NADPH:quinone reductase-like Zn-dependent oxidoreductase
MKAVVYRAYGDREQLVIHELPSPRPRDGELRVRVVFAALNPKDSFSAKRLAACSESRNW